MIIHLPQPSPRDMGVDLGGGEAGVAEEFLDGAQVGAGLEQVGGEGVAQGVRADAMLSAGAQQMAMDDAADAAGGEGAAAGVQKQPWERGRVRV